MEKTIVIAEILNYIDLEPEQIKSLYILDLTTLRIFLKNLKNNED